MSRAWFLVLASVSVGCFSPKAFEETDASGDGTSAETDPTMGTGGTEGPSTGPTATATDPTTATGPGDSGSGSDTGPAGDDPPVIGAFTVNGSPTPDDVTRSSLLVMEADVTDDNGVASVEFFEGDLLLGTATEAPFVLEVLVTSSQSGGYVYHAVATDTVEQTAVSDDVQLVVGVSGGEIVDVNEGLFEGCVYFGEFGGIAVVNPSRMVVAGTACPEAAGSDGDPTIVAIDDELDVLSSTTLEADFLYPPTAMDDGRVLVPSGEFISNSASANWRYNVFDPQIGEIEVGAGLLYSNMPSGGPFALTLPDQGVFLMRSSAEAALLEADFDSAVWTTNLGLGSGSGAVKARALGASGDIYLLFDSDECPGAAENCLLKLTQDGSTDWVRGCPITRTSEDWHPTDKAESSTGFEPSRATSSRTRTPMVTS